MRRLLRCEWGVVRRDRTFWAAIVGFALLLCLGAWNGTRDVRAFQRDLPPLSEKEAETRRSNIKFFGTVASRGKREFTMWHPGILAYQMWPYNALPPAPLAATSVGQSDLRVHIIQARSRFDMAGTKDEIDNPVNLLSGRYDLTFALVFLLPLLVVGTCYNLLSGERESGTLTLSLTQPISLQQLLLAKVLTRAIPIVAVTLAVPVTFLLLNGLKLEYPGVAGRMAMWTGLVLIYCAFWFSLSIWVNARGGSAASNALWLMGVWLLFVFVIPAFVTSAVSQLPAPPRLALAQALYGSEDRFVEQGPQILEAYYRAHPNDRPKRFRAPSKTKTDYDLYWTQRFAVNIALDNELASLLDGVESAARRRSRFERTLSVFSPTLLAQGAFSDIAGSGDERYSEFVNQVDTFRTRYRDFFAPLVYRNIGLPPERWSEVPRFTFREESLSAIAIRVSPAYAILLAITLVLAIHGNVLLRRYPVTR